MRTGWRSGAVIAAASAAVLALGGCTATAPDAPPTLPPDGVSVEIFQNRPDYAVRVLEIGVTNAGDTDLDLVSASFESPYFTGSADWDEPLTIRAGSTTDLRVPLGEAVCEGNRDGTGRVTLVWRPGDTPARGKPAGAADPASTRTATLAPSDTKGTIERITGEDCLAAAVESVIAITEPGVLRIEGVGAASVAWLDLTLTPTGADGSVTVERVSATVLLASASGLDWPVGVTLNAASAPQTVSLGLRPTRCDPHAVAEDKRGTIFPVVVATSSGPAGAYNFPVGDALRGQIYSWIAEHCGY